MRWFPALWLLPLASCTLVPDAERAAPTAAVAAESPPAPESSPAAAGGAATTDTANAEGPLAPSPAPAAPGPGCASPKRPEPRLTTEQRECGPAEDHCLRPGAWFAETVSAKLVDPAFECGGRFYGWQQLGESTRATHRTRPARDADIQVGARIIYYVHNTGRSELPLTEHDAHNPKKWQIGVVSKLYPDRRRFELETDVIDRPYEAARVILETR